MSNAYIARQPIVDRQEAIFAYELFFRQSSVNRAVVSGGSEAAASVMATALNDFGLRALLQDKEGFVSLAPAMLYDESLGALPADRFVLKLALEGLKPAHLEMVDTLIEEGFRFALSGDGAAFEAASKEWLERALWLAVDTGDMDRAALEAFAAKQGAYLGRMIALRVEDYTHYALCKKLGFGGFQGFFFAKPAVMKGRKLSPSRVVVLKLLEELSSGTDMKAVELTFDKNPELSINLLRYLSSSHFSTRAPVKTIHQALGLLGRAGLTQWLMLMLYGAEKSGGRRHTLAQMALLRGRIMHQLASELGKKELAQSAFVVGMLSLLDALFEMPMAEILEGSLLDESIQRALLERKGPLGTLLAIALRIERGEFTQLEAWLKKLGKNIDLLARVLSSSYAWVAKGEEGV